MKKYIPTLLLGACLAFDTWGQPFGDLFATVIAAPAKAAPNARA